MQISMDDLELQCWDCKGTGKVESDEGRVPCDKCNGTGVVLTALGQTLLAFMQKHLNHGGL
ncbi:tryptophan RNA-binding attenuation protein [Alicyclobacillus fastidiosus]|uniref:Tryptophan RNA-binding attenuation protein n=2 Tax=Alicyclobacillus fastidiosus TaxID=392011 RepID=A0ABY6ZHS4_9BACL|nr:tryptophan RNA-binding attenuation protein [Alicyclobacillus fastidiosus]WAH42454.1 tryptophan RNA-binding attenuation protein [Alicyclobacillus fastidiosus]